jgi:hypothetical protein
VILVLACACIDSLVWRLIYVCEVPRGRLVEAVCVLVHSTQHQHMNDFEFLDEYMVVPFPELQLQLVSECEEWIV